MATKRNNRGDRRNFWGILYLETESYSCDEVLTKITDYFEEWAFALHDKDTDHQGNLKKAHIHWYGRVSSPRQFAAVSNYLGVAENYFEAPQSEKKCIRYLVHADHRTKYQYDIDIIETNNEEWLEKYFSTGREQSVQAAMLAEFIVSSMCTEMRELVGFSLDNDCYGELRRGATIWRQMLQENRNFYSAYET